ncbi:hypothetical protein HGRIS_000096 [Hohenbuehelia grisea]|uniref:Uncharacterized protein n=1 Tax=Hohenbuehelia grisea TaxID=104357 RepID=A0ABR3JR30_9AGAR
MFSTVGSASLSAPKGGHKASAKKYSMPMPQSFSVRIFKNPTFSSVPHTTAKFDIGYRSTAFAVPVERRQSQTWAPSHRQDVEARLYSNFYPPPSFPPSNNVSSNTRAYDSRGAGTIPKYSIYPNTTKDTFIYEASLSSKSDLYSNSDDTASSTTIATPPSSFFSPALSTDSTTSVKSDAPAEQTPSRTGLRSSPPSSVTRSSSYAQAPPISRNPSTSAVNASHDASIYSTALTVCRVPSSRASHEHPSNGSGVLGRSVTPQATQRGSLGVSGYPVNSYFTANAATHALARSYPSDPWQDALDESLLDAASDLARLNASYNAIPPSTYPAPSADYHESIAPIPLPPDHSGRYISDAEYSRFLPDGGPRRASPEQIVYGGDGTAQIAADDGGSADWYFAQQTESGSLSQASSAFSSGPSGQFPEPRTQPSAASSGLPFGGLTSAPSRNGSSNGSDSGSSQPPPIPLQTRPPNAAASFPSTGQLGAYQPFSSSSQYLVSDTPTFPTNGGDPLYSLPATTAYSQSQGLNPAGSAQAALPVPFPSFSEAVSARVPSRTPSLSPPPSALDTGRTRKDSIAVEAARMIRRQDRPASVSPPPTEPRSRQSSATSEASRAMALMTISARTQVANPAAGMVIQPPPSAQFSQISKSSTVVTQNQAREVNTRSPSLPSLVHPQQTGQSVQAPGPGIQNTQAAQAPRRPLPQPVRRGSDTAVIPPPQQSNVKKPAFPEPLRRHSDGDQVPHHTGVPLAVSRLRVRWNECLVCPSPIFPSQRRKGWFNRRGDQLWTNEGAYKPPADGGEYPVDLDGYPEYGQGWMNEEGMRIDMEHRLVPKVPLKSALKQPPQ